MMAALDELLYAKLGPLVGNRCYPVIAPATVVKPYITHADIVNRADVDLDGGAPADMNRRARKQIDCWAESSAGAKTLADDVRTALDAANPTTEFAAAEADGSGQQFYEPDAKLHRVSLDFLVWQV